MQCFTSYAAQIFLSPFSLSFFHPLYFFSFLINYYTSFFISLNHPQKNSNVIVIFVFLSHMPYPFIFFLIFYNWMILIFFLAIYLLLLFFLLFSLLTFITNTLFLHLFILSYSPHVHFLCLNPVIAAEVHAHLSSVFAAQQPPSQGGPIPNCQETLRKHIRLSVREKLGHVVGARMVGLEGDRG